MYSFLYPAYILVTNNFNEHFGEPSLDGDNIWTYIVNVLLNSVMQLRASRKAGNFLTIWATTSCCWRTLRPSILACSNRDTARSTGLIGLQRSSCFCHSHIVMNFTSSSTALAKTFLWGWSLWVWGNATLFKQMPCLLKTQAAIISRHASMSLWGVSPPIGQYADIQSKSTQCCCANGPTIYYWLTDALWQSYFRSRCNKHP